MDEQELADRQRLVDKARLWLGTPYHHRGRVLGAGCDCAQLLAAAFHDAGLLPYIEPEVYSRDWHLHRGEEKYLSQIEKVLRRLPDEGTAISTRSPRPEYLPGDVIMFRLGRTFSHSAMVTKWPFIIHASAPAQIVEETDLTGTPMAYLPVRIYSYWGPK